MNGAAVLAELLARYGVDFVFGVPGDTNVRFYEALHDSGKVRHVMARDERSAVFMADAYARVARRPGVAECPSGAGAMYSLPGVAEANASSIPVLLFTSDIPLRGEGRGTITELDVARLFEPVTKASFQVKTVGKLAESIRRAFRVATTGRPGAVHVALPEEVLAGEPSVDREQLHIEPECRAYPAYPTRGAAERIRELARLLDAAERPAIVAGGGVNHSGCGKELIALAERIGAPVVTTITGQGIMPDEHRLALGVIGDNGYHPHAFHAVDRADVLLYVGCKMGSVATIGWTLPAAGPGRRIAQIDLDPEVLGNTYESTLSIAGDARLVLADLVLLVRARDEECAGWVAGLNAERARFWRDSAAALTSAASPLKPQRVIHELNRRLPSPATVIADAGTPTPYVSRFLKLRGDGSRLIIPRAFGGLGYAIPAGVGAWLARPDARPIALFGDGSLGMSAGELETAARLGAPVVFIHFNNACFGWIKALQALHGFAAPLSVDFTPLDAAKVAGAFGVRAWHVETPEQLTDALDHAFAAPGPAMVDIATESVAADLPPVFSWLRAAGRDPLREGPGGADAPERAPAAGLWASAGGARNVS